MTRAVLYARVSTARQAGSDRFSLGDQQENFEARCNERGYEPVGTYQDAESGRKDSRAQYQAMLKDAAAHRFDVIVVTYLDRFGRRDEEIAYRTLELRRMGITVDATRESTESFIDLFLSAWKAGQDSERIAARVRSTMAVAARGGGVTGVPAYGYRVRDKRYVLEPFEAEVVRGIFKAYIEGNQSQLRIAMDLNAREVPRPRRSGPWSAVTIGSILNRRTYTGDVTWGGELVSGARPAIIDVATFEAARARGAVKRSLPYGRTQISQYLLSGLVWCARCGGRMIGHSSRDPHGVPTYLSYVCSNHRKKGKCSTNSHRAEVLEHAVLDVLRLGDTLEAHQRAQDEATRLEGLMAGVEASLAGIPARFERDLDRFNRGVYASEAQYGLANRMLEEEQGLLERERDRLRDEIARARLSVTHVETAELMRADWEAFDTLAMAEKKAWLQQVIERIDCDAAKAPRVRLRFG